MASPATDSPPSSTEFQHHELTLQGGFASRCVMAMQKPVSMRPRPGPCSSPDSRWPTPPLGHPAQFTWQQTDYTLGSAPVSGGGMILVAIPLPREFSQTVQQVEASQQRYYDLARERKLVRRTYMGLSAAADHDRAICDHLAGIVSVEDCDAPAGGPGRSHAGNFSRTPRLSRRRQRRRRNRRPGALFQPHGRGTGRPAAARSKPPAAT